MLQVSHVSAGARGKPPFWMKWLDRAFPKKTKSRGGASLLLQQAKAEYQACHISESEPCALKDIKAPTLIYPGGNTTCINGDPYAFVVAPGDRHKVLYYFEGGGACWQGLGGMAVMKCTDGMEYGTYTAGLGAGVQNRQNLKNPFRSHTVVEPIYCSGDAHIGANVLQSEGKDWPQHGYANAKATFDWARANFDYELSSFVAMGFSAGALGTMAWSRTLLETFRYEKAAVVLDSYAAVFPPKTQQATMKYWGMCRADILLSSQQRQSCKRSALTVQDIFDQTMIAFPHVAFASIQSKADETQIFFYKGMAASYGRFLDAGVTSNGFYMMTNKVFMKYAYNHPNFVTYWVDGDKHCFTDSETLFTATSRGPTEGPVPGELSLVDWLGDVVEHKPITSQCHARSISYYPEFEQDVDYCVPGAGRAHMRLTHSGGP